uniref:ST3 beta-galactoside alpha-2,3-sialyltransferase 1 n=1 Tax=Sinocyclocheilus anshuiensis TaxID=1608454 RepID=A0A671M411_9TELE
MTRSLKLHAPVNLASWALWTMTGSFTDTIPAFHLYGGGNALELCRNSQCENEDTNLSYLDGLRTMSLLCKPVLTKPFSLMLILSFQIFVQGLQPSMFRVNYTKVVDQMFSLFPDEEHYSDAGPDRCRTCAVVGNSANLLGSHYGSLIDFHDVVIRINKSPPKGYERDMGSKTTHRILYPESAVDFDNSTHLVTFTTRHITSIHVIKFIYPSTGFITIIFALHICDQVKLFAFSSKVIHKICQDRG